jgi:hypothetical protein
MTKQKLYKVVWINQETGAEMTSYVITTGMGRIEEEYGDIISVEPIINFECYE